MIPLYCEDGRAYVWNDKDWYELRTKHRICGSLIGSIPSFPRQNDYLGFPMSLLPEEAALLTEMGACELLQVTDLTAEPSDKMKRASDEFQDKLFEEQSQLLKEKRIEQISQKIDLIIAGKKKKLISKGESVTEETLGRSTLLQEQIDKLPPLARAYALIQIPTQHPWPMKCKKLSVEELKGVDPVRYSVFKDLWKKGHHITDGSKFGGDFLVYPGEPVKFHATLIVRCVASEQTCLRPTELVAFGRLAVAVNKRAVVATLTEQGEVTYQTLQWHDTLED